MAVVKCPWVTCAYNRSNVVGEAGVCSRDEMLLVVVHEEVGENLLQCENHTWDKSKTLEYKGE